MPCKLRTTKRPSKLLESDSENNESNNIRKTKHACIVEAQESTRKLLESTLSKDHEYHIAGKGYNSISHSNLAHKLLPMLQAMKIPDAKAAVDKEWEKLEMFVSVRVKRRLFWKHKERKRKSTLLH